MSVVPSTMRSILAHSDFELIDLIFVVVIRHLLMRLAISSVM